MNNSTALAHARYGALGESVSIGSDIQKRAFDHLDWLLDDNRWQLDGEFDDINKFLRTVDLSGEKIAASDRKRLVEKLSKLNGSHRALASAVGVSPETINRDVATNVAPASKKPKKTKGKKKPPATNVAPATKSTPTPNGDTDKDHQRANRERVEFAVEDIKHLISCLSPGLKAVPVLRSGIKSKAQAKRLIDGLTEVERLAREVVNGWNDDKE